MINPDAAEQLEGVLTAGQFTASLIASGLNGDMSPFAFSTGGMMIGALKEAVEGTPLSRIFASAVNPDPAQPQPGLDNFMDQHSLTWNVLSARMGQP